MENADHEQNQNFALVVEAERERERNPKSRMLSAPKCFNACGIVQRFRQMNRISVGRSSKLIYRFDCCRKAFGEDCILRRGNEGLRNRDYLMRDVGFTRNPTELVRRGGGFYKHLNGFLSDSSSWRGSKPSHDAVSLSFVKFYLNSAVRFVYICKSADLSLILVHERLK